MPADIEDRKLPLLPYTPTIMPGSAPIKYPKADDEMRGLEPIHNQLIYQRYGIMAVGGGALKGAHYDIMRNNINKYMDFERFFAIWRIDPPWKAVSKKSQGKKLGGGKGKIHHYETPVRAGRVLIEVSGIGEFAEIQSMLKTICGKLPLYAMPVSQEIIEDIRREKMERDARNINPFVFNDLLRRNFSNSQQQIGIKELH